MAAKHFAQHGTPASTQHDAPSATQHEASSTPHDASSTVAPSAGTSSVETPPANTPSPNAPGDELPKHAAQTESPQHDADGPSKRDRHHDTAGADAKHRKHFRGGAVVAIVVLLVVAATVVLAAVPATREALFGASEPETTSEATSGDSESGNGEQTSDAAASTENDADASSSAEESATEAEEQPAADEAAQEAAEPEPVDDDSAYDATVEATTRTTASGISITAAPGFEDTKTGQALEQALASITSEGYEVAFVMQDLATGKGVSYNADAKMYPASSIKSSYCTWVLESTGGSGASSTMENCLVNSSNEAYHSLLSSYGLSSYSSWLSQYAPEASSEAARRYYPYISANGFANVWKEIYRYGNSGEGGSSFLAQCLAATNHSAMGGLLRSRYTVWSKPGWYPADGSGLQATNDCGVVFSDCGNYVYVILTDVPDDFSTVFPLVDAINATHGKICGGHSALYVNDNTTVSGGGE